MQPVTSSAAPGMRRRWRNACSSLPALVMARRRGPPPVSTTYRPRSRNYLARPLPERARTLAQLAWQAYIAQAAMRLTSVAPSAYLTSSAIYLTGADEPFATNLLLPKGKIHTLINQIRSRSPLFERVTSLATLVTTRVLRKASVVYNAFGP